MLFSEYKELCMEIDRIINEALDKIEAHDDRTFTPIDQFGPVLVPKECSDFDAVEVYDHGHGGIGGPGSSFVTAFGLKGDRIMWSTVGDAKNPAKMVLPSTNEKEASKLENPLYLRATQKDVTGKLSTEKIELKIEQTDKSINQWM